MRFATAAIVSLVWSICGFGQTQTQQEKAPATKLEAFQARSGIVLVRGFTTVAKIAGQSGMITIDAREFRDARNPSSRTTGVSVEVAEIGRLERSNTSYVDADESDSLLVGIDYVFKIGKDVTTFDNFEANYRTKGDLQITVFNNSNGKIMAAVSSGNIGKTQSFLAIEQLPKVRDAIALAKSKLE